MFGGMIIKPSGPPLPYMAVDSGEDENDEIICLHHPDGYTIYACRAHRRERCNDCMTDLSPGNQMSRQDFLSTKAKAARRGETDPNSAEYLPDVCGRNVPNGRDVCCRPNAAKINVIFIQLADQVS